MGMVGHRACVLVVAGLGFAAWVVALAGIATITSDCYSHSETESCVKTLQYQWWGLWFEFIVLALVVGYAFVNNLAMHQGTLQALLATVTAVDMWNANQFIITQSIPASIPNVRQSGLNAAAAGYIMFLTFNTFIMFALGSGFVWTGGDTSGAAYAYSGKGGGGGGGAEPGGGVRQSGPNFAAPATFASPLSGGGARAYLPNSPTTEPTISATRY